MRVLREVFMLNAVRHGGMSVVMEYLVLMTEWSTKLGIRPVNDDTLLLNLP